LRKKKPSRHLNSHSVKPSIPMNIVFQADQW